MSILSQNFSLSAFIDRKALQETIQQGLGGRFRNQRVLALIPDHTRSLPLPDLFRLVVETLFDVHQLDFMVALGTHPCLTEDELNRLVGITAEERSTTFRNIGLFNHEWNKPEQLTSLGVMGQDEIRHIAGSTWHPSLPDEIDIRINKLALEYDAILIIGPTMPHEVVGLSGGAKYLFPGISGPEMINATHWLGALSTIVATIGLKDTPVRAMIHAGARRLPTPVTLIVLVMVDHNLAGIFIGDLLEAWEEAAHLSTQRNICWVQSPIKQVLAWAPPMYDELWTAAKAVYKVQPVLAPGGEVILYAPHLDTVSKVHGRYIYEIGYHILPYYLSDWERFKHIPLGVLAHSTHLRGPGVMDNSIEKPGLIEKPNFRVTLATRLLPEDCARLSLGYLDPAGIRVQDFQDRQDEGILYIPRAGETLFRLTV